MAGKQEKKGFNTKVTKNTKRTKEKRNNKILLSFFLVILVLNLPFFAAI
jgi:hypothetical protein